MAYISSRLASLLDRAIALRDTLLSSTLLPNLKLEAHDMSGKTVIITGANVGIGLETARLLATYDAKVVLACRSRDKAEAARDDIVATTMNNSVEVEIVDFASLDSVRAFAERWGDRKVDVLINNAGAMAGRFELSDSGYEKGFTTNFLSHVLLTLLLLPSLAPGARVINVASIAQYDAVARHLDPSDVDSAAYLRTGCHLKEGDVMNPSVAAEMYQKSKFAQVVFSRMLQAKLDESVQYKDRHILVVSLHPGVVKSAIWDRNAAMSDEHDKWISTMNGIVRKIGINTVQGAMTSAWLAVTPAENIVGGGYYARQTLRTPNALAEDKKLCDAIWPAWIAASKAPDVV